MIALVILAALALAAFLVLAQKLFGFAAIESPAEETFMAAAAEAGLSKAEAA